jgi:hypothetical protein
MTRQELIIEIALVKQRLAVTTSQIERVELTCALIELYNSVVSLDTALIEREAA